MAARTLQFVHPFASNRNFRGIELMWGARSLLRGEILCDVLQIALREVGHVSRLSRDSSAEIEDEECSRLLEEDAQLVWGAVGTTKGGVGGLHLGVVEFGLAKQVGVRARPHEVVLGVAVDEAEEVA